MKKIGFGFLCLSLLLAVSCSGDDDDDGSTARTSLETTTASESADARQPGGEVVLAGNEFTGLDPHQLSDRPDISLTRMLYRPLYSLDGEYEITAEANGIAVELPEVSADGKVVTVRIQPDLRWSDGDDLLAEDFAAGIRRTCNPVVAAEYQFVLSNIVGCNELYRADPASDDLVALDAAVGVAALDDHTVEFRLDNPQPTFTSILSLWPASPSPVHLERFANDTPEAPGEWGFDGAELAFNGPYVLTEYVQQDHVTLEPNPNWSGSTRPTLERITIRFIDDLAVAATAFRTDEIDFATADLSQFNQLRSEFAEELVSLSVAPSTRGLKMQLENEVLADLDVRLALARAIDRERLAEVVFQNGFQTTTAWIPGEVSGVEEGTYDDVVGFDPEAAREHLARAGYPDGEGFPTLSILVLDSPDTRALAEFIQEGYRRELNIEISIEIVDRPTRSDRTANKQYELNYGGWTQDYPDPENWILGLFETDGVSNDYSCSDPEIDALIAEASFNPDDEERREQYREIEALIVGRVCGIVPLLKETRNYLVSSRLSGFAENANALDLLIAGDWRAEAWGLAAE